jgi:hypothetical protein
MTQLAHTECIQAAALTPSRFIGLSAMRLINAMTIEAGDVSDIPRGRKTSERKYAKKVMRDAIKFGLTIDKPYQIRDVGGGRKGLFVLGYDGIYFAR